MSACPVCLGVGQVSQVVKCPNYNGYNHSCVRCLGHKIVDVEGRFPKVTCAACHGSGQRPTWMDDSRSVPNRDPNFNYAEHQW